MSKKVAKPFKFGQPILVYASLCRSRMGRKRYWTSLPYQEPKKGIFLGYRTLSNGEIDNDEDGTWFSGSQFIKGAWICIEGKNPEKVLLSSITEVTGSGAIEK